MDIKPPFEAKADPALRRALAGAEGQDVLQVLLLLAPTTPTSDWGPDPDPKAFGSRAEYRHALSERQRARIQAEIGPALEALSRLGLSPKGGGLSRGVVVEGPAKALAAALELPGVAHATLDRPIELVAPRKP